MAPSGGADPVGVELLTERLRLRAWRPEDGPAVAAIMATGRVHTYLRGLPDPYTVEDAHRFVTEFAPAAVAGGSALECAVTDRDDGRLVGAAALRLPRASAAATIGYWIDPARWGLGYAREATRALAQWGFSSAGIDRIEISCDVRNVASAKVALHAGFGFEGVRRDAHAQFGRLAADPGEAVGPAFAAPAGGVLTDGVITLRMPAVEDLIGFAEQEEDPDTVAVGSLGHARPRAAMADLLARGRLDWLVGQVAPFTIVDVTTGSFAGSIHVRRAGPRDVAELGYAVHPAFRRRGVATRAIGLASSWALGEGGFARVELGAKRHNVASLHAARAAGFTEEGVARARLRNPDGSHSDEVRYALLRG